jgi:predicted phosphodiesterase
MHNYVQIHDGSLPQPPNTVRFVCVSDTHSRFFCYIPGDVLIHAAEYLHRAPYAHKVVIAGNHELPFDVANYEAIIARRKITQHCDPAATKCLLGHVCYLEDNLAVVEGYRIWGCPWTKHKNGAFYLVDKEMRVRKWASMPEGVDILVTHSPPFEIMDISRQGKPAGCKDLLKRVKKVKPKVHVFGHTHAGYGFSHIEGITFVNAAICNNDYEPVNPPLVFDLPRLR